MSAPESNWMVNDEDIEIDALLCQVPDPSTSSPLHAAEPQWNSDDEALDALLCEAVEQTEETSKVDATDATEKSLDSGEDDFFAEIPLPDVNHAVPGFTRSKKEAHVIDTGFTTAAGTVLKIAAASKKKAEAIFEETQEN